MLNLKTQSLAIKIVSLKLPHTADLFRLTTKIACRNNKNLLCALGLRDLSLTSPVMLHDKICKRWSLSYQNMRKLHIFMTLYKHKVCICINYTYAYITNAHKHGCT